MDGEMRNQGRGLTIFLSLFLGCFSVIFPMATKSMAYTETRSINGTKIRWKQPVKLNLLGNPLNTNSISEQAFYGAAVRSLQRWGAAGSGSVNFDYWQGGDKRIFETNSDYNGYSSIYFASSAGGGDTGLSSHVIGLTQVWYNTNTGEIMESDIILNDKDFYFTMNPADTSGYGGYGKNRTSLGSGENKVFIENVITHELGHALGLSHTESLQSTMLFMESPEQAYLSCDEQIAIRALYQAGNLYNRGGITGSIISESGISESGAPVFGAHVLAISRRRGTILATALTDKSGNYTIDALEPGDYFIMVEPFVVSSQTLPAFYTGLNHNICTEHTFFARGFLTDGTMNTLQPIEVQQGQSVTAPTFKVACGAQGAAAVKTIIFSTDFATAPEIFDGATYKPGFGVVDRLSNGKSAYYLLRSLSGHIEISGMAYTLYSPIIVNLSLLDRYGQLVPGTKSKVAYTGESGFINYDAMLVFDGLEPSDYVLKVEQANSAANTYFPYPAYPAYPGGSSLLDPAPFFLIVGSVNEPRPVLEHELSFNPRCRMDENFPKYSSPDKIPSRTSDSQKNSGGFCSSTRIIKSSSSNQNVNDQVPIESHAVATWFLPFLFVWGFARLCFSKENS
ncbi:MAG: matrixin family metalloprotease [Candidatus Poribacteria bacterium]